MLGDLFRAPAQMDHTLIGRMQNLPAGLRSFHKHPKAQGSCLISLALPWGVHYTKTKVPVP
jgi:hypothetical protein